MEDTYRHKGLRRQLVNAVAERQNLDQKVIDAMNKVPRHLFLDSSFEQHAYDDKAFQIGAGQTISQPTIVALQTQLLQVEKGMKVLEVGTGSGYQCAVLNELGARVYSIERQRTLYLKTKQLLSKLRYNVRIQFGDGYKGWKSIAPFDRIIVTCGAPKVPEILVDQLKEHGKMVVPVGEAHQEMMLVSKTESGIVQEEQGGCSFVPMLENIEK